MTEIQEMPDPDSPVHGHRRTRSRRRLVKRAVLVSGVSLIALTCAATATFYVAGRNLADGIGRIPNVFKGLNASNQPGVPAAYRQSMTILVVGSDSRSEVRPTVASSRKPLGSDAIMLVHIDADRRAVSAISIPRNSWVDVPGHGMTSFYQVLALGGPALMIRTVEHLTGVRINHYAVIDFAGLRNVIQVLGGVQVEIASQSSRGGVTFHKGLNDLTPKEAMVYVSTTTRPAECRCWQRNGVPGGDLTRVQRQQNLIRAILAKTTSLHLLTKPLALYRLLDAFGHAVSVDSTFTNGQIRTLAFQLARLRGSGFTFLTAPVRGIGRRAGDGVVFLSAAQCAALWKAVRSDAVAAWVARHPASRIPRVPY